MNLFGKVLGPLAAAALLIAAAAAHAQAPSVLQANREYVRLDPPQQVAIADRIEVIEFFYYGCPICYELEPMLTRWSIDAPGGMRHWPRCASRQGRDRRLACAPGRRSAPASSRPWLSARRRCRWPSAMPRVASV